MKTYCLVFIKIFKKVGFQLIIEMSDQYFKHFFHDVTGGSIFVHWFVFDTKSENA